MKKTLLALAVLAATIFGASAQPVISYNSNLGIGFKSDLYIVNGTPSDLFNTGPAVTWDLSAETSTLMGEFNFVDPATTPYAASYPTSNLAMEQILTGFATTYIYANVSSTEMNILANGVGGTDEEIFTDYDKILQFPFNFGNSFTDTRQAAGEPLESFTRTYDSYGTLIINGNTYSDVVRVTKDVTSAIWYITNPIVCPVIIASDGLILYLEPTTFTGIENPNSVVHSVYPNPVMRNAAVTFRGTEAGSTVTLTDITGKQVAGLMTGPDNKVVIPQSLNAGLYFFSVRNRNGEESVGRLVVE